MLSEEELATLEGPWQFEPEYTKNGFGISRLVIRPSWGLSKLRTGLGYYEHPDPSDQGQQQPGDTVSLAELKQLAMNLLPVGSHLRGLILSEPDSLPQPLAIAKLEVFSRLLHKELDSS